MSTPEWTRQLAKLLLLPPAALLILAFVGVAIAGRRARLGRTLAIASLVMLTLLAMPVVGGLLVRSFGAVVPLDTSSIANAQAIVVLSGGTRRYAAEYRGPTVGTLTLERLRYAARLARQTGLPVLVSGGRVRHSPPEALLMREVMQEFGVQVRWIETRARTTHENAVNSAVILEANGVQRVILVGHSFDFPRSRKEFEAAGIQVIPAPINIPSEAPLDWGDFWPSVGGLRLSYYAMYEILGNARFDITQAFNGNSADTRSTPRSSSPLPRGS
jgi:uncharacterized SAM-binding protein YcdF (DUF218 family)